MNRALVVLVLAVAAFGCGDHATIDVLMPAVTSKPLGPTTTKPTPTPTPTGACDQGYTYQGFGGLRLEVGRDDEKVGFDRDRVKPLTALRGEYARVLGAAPVLLDSLSNTFGTTPPRWYVEPASNAVSLYSSLRVAFVGCLAATNTVDYDAAPTPANARVHCSEFAHRFWSRAAAADELDACVALVTTQTTEEPAARRKWAYACASVLSSASFLTY